jgi:hypothetical protein
MGLKLFIVLIFVPYAISVVAVMVMNSGMFAGLLDGWGKLWGVGAGVATALALGGLLTVAGMAYRAKEPVIASIAFAFFLACLVFSCMAAKGFGHLLGFTYPEQVAKTRNVRFEDEPGQIETIESKLSYFYETPNPYLANNGRHIVATGDEIVKVTNNCRIIGNAFEDSQCDRLAYLHAEKQARIECNSGARKRNCGLTRVSAAQATAVSGPFTKEDMARGKAVAAASAPFIFVAMASALGMIFFWVAHTLMNVKNDVPVQPEIIVPVEKPTYQEEFDYFDEWHTDLVKVKVGTPARDGDEFWSHYAKWCQKNGFPELSRQKFAKRFYGLHKDQFVKSGGTKYKDIILEDINGA